MGTTTVLDPAALDREAREATARTNSAEQTAFLLQTVGGRLTATALKLANPLPLYRWREGTEPDDPAHADRLRLLFRLAHQIHNAYGPRVLRVFLQQVDPYLDRRTPLAVLADDEPAAAERKLLVAVHGFLGT